MTISSKRKKITALPPALSRASKLKIAKFPSMKVLFTNAEQLTGSKMTELRTKIIQDKPMIVAVTEVNMKNSVKERSLEDFHIPDYNLHPVNLFNGTGLFIHTKLLKSQ